MGATRSDDSSRPPVAVAVLANDPISQSGVAVTFAGVDDVWIVGTVDDADAVASMTPAPDAVILMSALIDGWVVDQLERLGRSAPRSRPIVLVDALDVFRLLAATRAGATSFLLTGECTPELMLSVVRAAVLGMGRVPPAVVRELTNPNSALGAARIWRR